MLTLLSEGRCIMQVTSEIKLDERKILNKVTNDQFGMQVSREWKRLIDKYTPRDLGYLIQNYQLLPFAIWYKEIYAHYAYMGEKYVDPIYGVGAFYSPDYGFWSRPEVEKIPSGEKLKFKGFGTDHWDEKAAKSGELDKLYRIINNGLSTGQF